MSNAQFVRDIGEWLTDQALASPDILSMFEGLCRRLHAGGVAVERARLTWPTLHPLFRAETMLWVRDEAVEFEQFNHQEEASEAWKRSPMKYLFDNDVSVVRRRMTGPNAMFDFPVVEELAAEGFTDYLLIATSFDDGRTGISGEGLATTATGEESQGILVTWATKREGGFSDDDLDALHRIQRRFAVACKIAVQDRIAINITRTYLGTDAGDRVRAGSIKLGDGRTTEAVVWYADMRDSTALADRLAPQDFLDLLNDYFQAAAQPAIEAGGEILDFVGDAVVAIFPYDAHDESGRCRAVAAACRAMERARQAGEEICRRREEAGAEPFRFGLALTAGEVMFGNIGVPTRLAFSAIGPTLNLAARLEASTKGLGEPVVASAGFAADAPGAWRSLGTHALEGVSAPCELFAPEATGAKALAAA